MRTGESDYNEFQFILFHHGHSLQPEDVIGVGGGGGGGGEGPLCPPPQKKKYKYKMEARNSGKMREEFGQNSGKK